MGFSLRRADLSCLHLLQKPLIVSLCLSQHMIILSIHCLQVPSFLFSLFESGNAVVQLGGDSFTFSFQLGLLIPEMLNLHWSEALH